VKVSPGVAALLLLAGGLGHNVAHRYVEEAARGYVWNVTGALLLSMVLLMYAAEKRSVRVWLVTALLVGHQMQVAGCSVAFMAAPWTIEPGAD
jgi:cytochrome c biogenesis protein ResB